MANQTKLIRAAPNQPAVYLVIDGTKRHIADPNTFNHFNFSWGKVHEQEACVVASIPNGK